MCWCVEFCLSCTSVGGRCEEDMGSAARLLADGGGVQKAGSSGARGTYTPGQTFASSCSHLTREQFQPARVTRNTSACLDRARNVSTVS